MGNYHVRNCYSCQILTKLAFFRHFSKRTQTPKSMKIRPVGAELCRTDRQLFSADRQTVVSYRQTVVQCGQTDSCVIQTGSCSVRTDRQLCRTDRHNERRSCFRNIESMDPRQITPENTIACITDIHNTCKPRFCCRPTSFTPFCSNAPYQFTPLLNLHPHFCFDAL